MTINPIIAGKAPMTPASTQILFIDIQPGVVSDRSWCIPAPQAATLRRQIVLGKLRRPQQRQLQFVQPDLLRTTDVHDSALSA